jgi:atypical dual specificity phosphatase
MVKKKQPTSASGQKQPAACILADLLYLGPVSATSNTAFLQSHAITHILSIGKSPSSHIEGITYHRLSLTDEEDSQIAETVQKACDIIDAAEAARGRALVHCSAAISRSPAIVTGYLMKRRGITLRDSLAMVVNARAVVSPNLGFLRQLSEMEKDIFQGESSFDPSGLTSSTRLSAFLAL